MTPTPKLRFVERFVPAPEHGEGIGKKVRILQQRWEDKNIQLTVLQYDEYGTPIRNHPGEWRYVALGEE